MGTLLKNRKFYIGAAIIVVTVILIYAYYKYSEYYPSTDDAYVKAFIVNIAPKVSGHVDKVFVTHNQLVKKGDILFTIDATSYELAAEEANENYKFEASQLLVAEKDVSLVEAVINGAKAKVLYAERTFKRNSTLIITHAVSEQSLDDAECQVGVNQSILASAVVTLEQKKQAFETAKARVKIAKTKYDQALLDLSYTKIYAPVDGYVSNFTLRNGEFLHEGEKVFAIVDAEKWWIEANFKETDMARIKEGDMASVTLDMYNHKYDGLVQSISYGSGDSFSLLPPENATGNWIKVTQRFPVRILVDNSKEFPLRVGASAIVVVDTVKPGKEVKQEKI